MHIPKGNTSQLELVTFRQALEAANTPNEHYDISQWLYAPNFYSEYRYILGTRGKNPLICIGINPSTAEPGNLDNTLKSVDRIAKGNGFDSFIMFNVYAQRATNPDAMEKVCNPLLHQENLEAFCLCFLFLAKQRELLLFVLFVRFSLCRGLFGRLFCLRLTNSAVLATLLSCTALLQPL